MLTSPTIILLLLGCNLITAEVNSILTTSSGSEECRSNATHVAWRGGPCAAVEGADGGLEECYYETVDDARASMKHYLWKNIMPYDVPNAITLGFDRCSSREHSWQVVSSLVDGSVAAKGFYGIRSASRNALSNDSSSASSSASSSVWRKARESEADEFSSKPGTTVDGLADGIVNQTLHYSLLSKSAYAYTDAIPRSIFLEYVLPYAVVNEPRTDYRSLLHDQLHGQLNTQLHGQLHDQGGLTGQAELQIRTVVKSINTQLWARLGRPSLLDPSSPSSLQPIRFQAGLTPRIYDPLSVISYGHSSCTGLAVLMIAALRTIGIPARLVGTPAWHNNVDEGNHSWLEVYVPNNQVVNANNANNAAEATTHQIGDDTIGGKWIFLEPSPGIAEGDEGSANADDLDRDPCQRWFCNKDRFDGSTRVYASRYSAISTSKRAQRTGHAADAIDAWYDPMPSDTFYPMAWAVGEEGVPGEDRTEYYTHVCGQCDS